MKDFQRYAGILKAILILLLMNVFLGGNFVSMILTYIFIGLLLIIRSLVVPTDWRIKRYLIIVYAAVTTMQIIFTVLVVFREDQSLLQTIFSRLFGAIALLFPFLVERFVTINKYAKFYLPSVEELSNVSFAQIKSSTDKVIQAVEAVKKTRKAFSAENLNEIKSDLHRHSSFTYINKGVLTDAYFREAVASMDDPYLYIVISNTGSPASEIISTFTQKQYNHASLSFDQDLKTIISYNGGERVYPPGLNSEMLEYFNKKEDASIIVYRLACTMKQKQTVLEKVKEINREGSAYNMMGLVLKYSHKPNIMFCSQFVYKMLKIAGLAYFERRDGEVKPTDLVELDYYRKLQFAYEMRLNHPAKE